MKQIKKQGLVLRRNLGRLSPAGTESEESWAEQHTVIGVRETFLNYERQLGFSWKDSLRKIEVLTVGSNLEVEREGR